MFKNKWSYCLTDKQFTKLNRIIAKIPGLTEFVKEFDNSNLNDIILAYKEKIVDENQSTVGIRVNMEVAMKWFDLYKKEFEDNHKEDTSFADFKLDSILTWSPRPQWALGMTVQEIDYLDHFIPNVPNLSRYLYDKKDSHNLYDLVLFFQMRLNASGKNDPDTDFILETIKERFYRIMDDHKEAIHYVNHSHEIDDHDVLNNFSREASNSFFLTNLEKDVSSDFTNKYLQYSNPYIAGELFLRFFRANKTNVALLFAHKVFPYIFSAPNIYWHNKESVYGSVNILFCLIDALGNIELNKLQEKSLKIENAFIQSLYLLLSRTIYWSDKETIRNESYDENKLPINIQHKLRAYRLRAYLIDTYGSLITKDKSESDYSIMALADLFSAHEIAYTNRIVGKKSVYYWDAIRLFHKKKLFLFGSPAEVSEKGFCLNDDLAQDLHSKYRKGDFCLTDEEIAQLVSFLRMSFLQQKNEAKKSNTPIPYLRKDNYSPLYKKEKTQIIQYLIENDVHYFYHFTERDKIKSIIKYGGLLSYRRCLDEGIVMPLREDMALSRDKDAKLGLEDYARLSFCERLPKIRIRQKEGADLVLLKISTEVALFEETLFTDIEATHDSVKFGNTFEDLLRVNIPSTQKVCSVTDSRYLKSQAEVLIKGFIPLKYILNIDNPENIETLE